MPIKTLVHERPADIQKLTDDLAAEWRSPTESADAPVIIEDKPSRFAGQKSLIVIWEDWAQLPLIRRSEIVMDAYESSHSPEEVANVVSAIGYTRIEAERMGIRYK